MAETAGSRSSARDLASGTDHLRAAQCIREAEVIVYDHLVGPESSAHASPKARLIYAGKQGGRHTSPRGDQRPPVTEARKGRSSRGSRGDPFIFGRGGEEAEVSQGGGHPIRGRSRRQFGNRGARLCGNPAHPPEPHASVAFVTATRIPTKGKSSLDWPTLAGMGTLVVLMAVKNLSAVTENLIDHGKDAATPAALIRCGRHRTRRR